MLRYFAGPGLVGFMLLVFWLWAVLDVILTDDYRIRNMVKGTWIFLVVFVPVVGPICWILAGRPESNSLKPGGGGSYENNPYRSERRGYGTDGSTQSSSRGRRSRRPRIVGAEDSADWSVAGAKPSRPSSIEDGESLAVRQRKLLEHEAELAKREESLKEREANQDDTSPPSPEV